MPARLLLAGFLLAHAAIHAGFVSPAPAQTAGGPTWPFALDRSWLLSPLGLDSGLVRVLGLALSAATFGGYALAALATLGILPAGVWAGTVAVGTIASAALLLVFFRPWLAVGVGLDLVILWAVLLQSWTPDRLGS